MDFMKVIDQTVREIKREVNLKVLKVPEIEQKVLDATENEPWGPHGSALAEIAHATKKFSECQLVMNVLWTRLSDSGRDWRHVYKALSVIEYLVANGSERAVDDIIEHTLQISSLSGFEHVEPSGKDVGINVRKKVETIVGLLNDKDKIQAVRNKASTNRDKYFGLSSSGITYKSGSSSYNSSVGFGSNDSYGGQGSKIENDTFKEKYRDKDQFSEKELDRDTSAKSQGSAGQNHNISTKSVTHHIRKNQNPMSSGSKKPSRKFNDPDTNKSAPLPTSNVNIYEDDFDPRGTSTNKCAAGTADQIDLFGHSLVGDLMDTPTSIQSVSSDVDLFADATFVSAKSMENTQSQRNVDLFASQPPIPSTSSSAEPIDFFATSHPIVQSQTMSPTSSVIIDTNSMDPFASLPLNDFNESDSFGAFTSHTDSNSDSSTQKPLPDGKPKPKTLNAKPSFQVKSGIWADTLSRGLIDLNIAAPKKVSVAGGGSGWDMGKAMGSGTVSEQDLFRSFGK